MKDLSMVIEDFHLLCLCLGVRLSSVVGLLPREFERRLVLGQIAQFLPAFFGVLTLIGARNPEAFPLLIGKYLLLTGFVAVMGRGLAKRTRAQLQPLLAENMGLARAMVHPDLRSDLVTIAFAVGPVAFVVWRMWPGILTATLLVGFLLMVGRLAYWAIYERWIDAYLAGLGEPEAARPVG